ncbi:hypothetical protein Poly24_51060 [Rosistilla carotiformis]|uniref:Uncharacterized protein n=1 Tax=Rosistilla carotiformis TaxID=2528017 RepID=A0A518K0R1_9BACT|nr:hypothetical protein Poly24_51060 [Rosistilla carotiformis]
MGIPLSGCVSLVGSVVCEVLHVFYVVGHVHLVRHASPAVHVYMKVWDTTFWIGGRC